jgi:hypothetical protein
LNYLFDDENSEKKKKKHYRLVDVNRASYYYSYTAVILNIKAEEKLGGDNHAV